MIPTKDMTPHVPVRVEEIIAEVIESEKLGVSMVHLHARDHHGAPTYQKEVYADIISGIREKKPELIIVVSTSGRNFQEFEKRSDVLNLEGKLKPDMASLTLSSLNFAQSASVNSPETIMRLAKMMTEKGIKPELEIFDLGMVNFANYLIRKGILEPPYYFNILLGNIASAQATLMHAGIIISELPADSYYSITGIGDNQKAMNALAVILADGVRVGLEDNIWLDRERKQLATNMSLIEQVTRLAKAFDRPIAAANEVRAMLNLPGVQRG
ncbi:3-keto-5-aminohexanoate cleavage protein [Paenibacillus sp. WST5]|uniref:3-keto-5-aminohexanoate cleavage protein n=2 Tax=Paenibacillus sedimenti TaxID=2770274 RepID=A0A926QJ25_9BACL|nr:3-keto-5-aminohexanoate cleavage protein [Paenibacillus sedimenti]